MATEKLTNTIVQKLMPRDKEYEVHDAALKGFMVRVHPSGRKVYVVRYGRTKKKTIAPTDKMKVAEAREYARELQSQFARGMEVNAKNEDKKIVTFKVFIEGRYADWLRVNNKSGEEDIKTLYRHFRFLFDLPLDQIKLSDLDDWRVQKVSSGVMQRNTVNRTLTPLRSALNQAVAWGEIEVNPLSGLVAYQCDDSRERYLSREERRRLFRCLLLREKRRRAARERTLAHHASRVSAKQVGDFPKAGYTDSLMPLVLLATNTGLRKSELFGLEWVDVNFRQRTLYVKAGKTYSSRTVPLNKRALKVLNMWRSQTKGLASPYVFPSRTDVNKPVTTVKKAWSALRLDVGIEDFHWHDFRHDFASRLVMKGVSLYAVQRLLGHKSLQQTMKYAHFAPGFVEDSVGRLDSPI